MEGCATGSKIDEFDVARVSFVPIRDGGEEYNYKDAATKVGRYNDAWCVLDPRSAGGRTAKTLKGIRTVTIRTKKSGDNYVKFVAEIDPTSVKESEDHGHFAMARILSEDGHELATKRRLVFAPDTFPDDLVKEGGINESSPLRLTVVGIPRISLKLIHWRIQHALEQPGSDVLSWDLPYELIVMAAEKAP